MTRDQAATEPGALRIDKWLWFARFAKTRSLAARLCAAGAVTIGGAPALKPKAAVRVGDVVTVPQGRRLHTVRVTALGSRRGPAPEAQRLYEALEPPRPLVELEARWEPLLVEDEEPSGAVL